MTEMIVKLLLCLAGLSAAVMGGMMLLQPIRFVELERWWGENGIHWEKYDCPITRWGGIALLLVGTVLFLVMLTSLFIYFAF